MLELRTKAVTIFAAVFLVSCRPSDLRPRYVEQVYRNVDAVPLIAVFNIRPGSVSPVGQPQKFPSIYPSPVLLYKVNATIENVLKGDLSPGRAEFFYFTTASVTGPPKLGFYGSVPYRTLVLLRREQGLLRTATDISTDCSQLVTSGYHPKLVPTPNQPITKSIIDLLLNRGSGASDEGMVRAVFSWMPPRISLSYTCESLLRLATNETPPVRISACQRLRELMADTTYANPDEQSSIAKQLGIPDSQLAHWRAQYKELLESGYFTVHHPFRGDELPAVTPFAKTLSGLSLCTNDDAVGWR